MSEDVGASLAKAMGWDDETREERRRQSAKLDAIRKARRCHCKKSFAECLCGLSWWKRVIGNGKRERWNEALRISSSPEWTGEMNGRID